jgi:3-deoxy-7-phosphoheptulonate synthase
MLESFLKEGNQPFPKNPAQLRHGLSITDACLGWEATERLLCDGCEKLAKSAILTQNA